MSAQAFTEVSLPFQVPDTRMLLTLISFLILLNTINYLLDALLFVGLLGQILVGIAFGLPGGNLLGPHLEVAIVQLGYIGLLLLVFEGGLATSFASVRADFWRSSCIAITGMAIPIACSFLLTAMIEATLLQSFAAGAALCSTSLGMTFAIMQASGLKETRMAVVLSTAAVIDDVFGLIMVQIISNLGSTSKGFDAGTVIRPLFVSLGFGIAAPMVCRFFVLPATLFLIKWKIKNPSSALSRVLNHNWFPFASHLLTFMAMVTAGSYAGTSNLFTAYIAGAAISWWDEAIPDHPCILENPKQDQRSLGNARNMLPRSESGIETIPDQTTAVNTITIEEELRNPTIRKRSIPFTATMSPSNEVATTKRTTGASIFSTYFSPSLHRILKPFFFASIGFSVPITRMFTAPTVWRGFIYALIMLFGKAVCGLWLISIPRFSTSVCMTRIHRKQRDRSAGIVLPDAQPRSDDIDSRRTNDQDASGEVPSRSLIAEDEGISNAYPAAIVGCAMVTRGEIGFLISAVAEANGLFGDQHDSPLFLVVTWAILLCTLLGPLMLGLLTKHVRSLQSRYKDVRGKEVLGVWGHERR